MHTFPRNEKYALESNQNHDSHTRPLTSLRPFRLVSKSIRLNLADFSGRIGYTVQVGRLLRRRCRVVKCSLLLATAVSLTIKTNCLFWRVHHRLRHRERARLLLRHCCFRVTLSQHAYEILITNLAQSLEKTKLLESAMESSHNISGRSGALSHGRRVSRFFICGRIPMCHKCLRL